MLGPPLQGFMYPRLPVSTRVQLLTSAAWLSPRYSSFVILVCIVSFVVNPLQPLHPCSDLLRMRSPGRACLSGKKAKAQRP